ncbi:phosphatase 2C-like domain-containing protein [Rhypophila decipiens]|uniref:Protein phosphatase n=1 Tax=Rhypophila decipiens TaxID=261697 RepID=A0AAN6YJ88_9PEZI|nr:phosphatase 2C-like domain-containing protein [Rhypophila decipiens]
MAATSASRTLAVQCRPRLLRPCMSSTRNSRCNSILAGTSTSFSPRNFTQPTATMRHLARSSSSKHRIPADASSGRIRSLSSSSTSPTDSNRKHVYNVAASYIAKGNPNFDPETHVFHFNPYNRVQPPKLGKKYKSLRPASGQDAFFVSRLGASNPGCGEVALGVADGVGGWMDSGVDPADFSHALCDYMAAAAYEHSPSGTGNGLTARQVMQKGYEAVCHDRTIKAGGSTAVVALLREKGMLEVANLGDSGFIILRLNGVHAASEPQIHAFNTPFQLSVVPQSMLLRAAAFGGAQLMDEPRDAEVSRLQLKHGDVLVVATDGLWDNLFNQDILRIVSSRMTDSGAWETTDSGVQVAPDLRSFTGSGGSSNTLQSLLATDIVASAKSASRNTRLDGPFAKEVKKYYPHEAWHGGKEDDICAVVVVVSEEECPPIKAKL